MFLHKIFFSISFTLSIPIMLIGINGGYFSAIFRVCLHMSQLEFQIFSAGVSSLVGAYYLQPLDAHATAV